MAFVDKTLEEMLREIQVRHTLRYDIIISSRDPKCPKEWAPPANYEYVPTPMDVRNEKDATTVYITNYLGFDTELFETIRARRGEIERICSAPHIHPIGYTLENAFYHGNQNNPDLPVYFMAFEGDKGIVVSIKDSGEGFDYNKTIEKAKACFKKFNGVRKTFSYDKDERYFKRWGTCFWTYMAYPMDVSFEDNGTRVNLLFMDSECYRGGRVI